MTSIEPLLTAKELSKAIGGTMSESAIRDAMHRTSLSQNPLPRIESGRKRKVRRTDLSTFKQWLQAEKELSIRNA